MATITENLQTIKNSTLAMKQAIIDRGGNINGDITTWANSITDIPSRESDFANINNLLQAIISGKELISFTIDETQYYAEDGMTWGDWVNSEYNIDGYEKSFGLGDLPIHTPGGNGEVHDPNTEWFVCPDDTIINNHNYYIKPY